MERTESHIKIWFWTRDAGNVPSDVRNGAPSVDPNSWVCYSNAHYEMVGFTELKGRTRCLLPQQYVPNWPKIWTAQYYDQLYVQNLCRDIEGH